MRSRAAFRGLLEAYNVARPAVHLSFQPMSHFSERVFLPAVVAQGGQVGFASDGGARVFEDARALGPTMFSTVPRVFEVLRGRHERRLKAALEGADAADHAEITERVLAETRLEFGPRLQTISSVSAPCSAATFRFLQTCFRDCLVSDGYGSTECGSITVNDRIAPGVEVKLIDAPELGYSIRDVPPRGEICVKTAHMVSGYLGDARSTSERFDADGFFHTGDLGQREADGSVRVIGRRRNVIKLANGEFVAPEAIEGALLASPAVEQVFVHAEGERHCVVALVHGPRPGAASADVLAALRDAGRGAGLLPFQIPAAVHVLEEPFTVESGLLTSSRKINRRAVRARYGPVLAALYDSVAEQAPASALDLVRRAAQAALGGGVDAEADLTQHLGVDSLAAVELAHALEEQLGREVPLRVLLSSGSLADVASKLAAEAGASVSGARSDSLREQVEADLALELDLPAALPVAEAPPKAVLLTGATGFLGLHLLADLLAHGVGRVHCLVRCADAEAGRARLLARGADARIELEAALASGQLVVEPGDLSKSDLGLSTEAWSRLGAAVDLVIHAGAVVNWVMLYGQLRAANVLGTHALLRLAFSRRRIPFVYVSTISTVATGADETALLPLDRALGGTPYALSKWVGERLVRRARDAGLPVTVHRPSMITAHSVTGASNETDFVHRYLRGVAALGLNLDEPAALDMTPVDFVSDGIVRLALAGEGIGSTLHLTNVHRSLSYAELGPALSACGLDVRNVPYAEFRAALDAASRSGDEPSPLLPLRSFFPARGFGLGMGPWPCTESERLLTEHGVALPAAVSVETIRVAVDALRAKGLLALS
jgi:fatty acid CoA ligase FadD9